MTYLQLKGMLDIFEVNPRYDDVERDYAKLPMKKVASNHNIVLNLGFNIIANRLTDDGNTYDDTTLRYFAWSNGTTDPAATDTASTFYADGSAWATKAVESYDYSVANKRQTWNCYISSLENTVTSISKFLLGNANPITYAFSEVEFTPLSKNSSKSFYLRYRLTMS